MEKFLKSTEYIDWTSTNVFLKARELSAGLNDDKLIAKKCFEFVRDEIKHSKDFQLNPVTAKASDVLKHGTGYCYAKSHLLSALLRANNILSGLCYQRLTIENNQPPFCLHGLNTIYIEPYGWYRVDARGNKQGISASFNPPIENLAFDIITEGEANLPKIYSEPLRAVIDTLENNKTYLDVAQNLPDINLDLS